jgi:cobalamin-dependent methionine synthase I
VPVASSLISNELRDAFMSDVTKDYDRVREQNKNAQSQNKFIPIAEARENKFPIDWEKTEITKPTFQITGVTKIELSSLTNDNMQEQWEDIAIETMEYLHQAIELLEAHTAQFDTVSDGDFSVKYVADYPQDVKRFLEKVKK